MTENENLLYNPSFEGDWTRDTHIGTAFGEIYTPEGWTWYWKEEGQFRRPECQVINKEPPFLDPPRVSHGNRAVKCFTMFGRMHAGLYQVVEGLEPGAVYRLTAEAHAWSAHKGVLSVDDPGCSAGVGCEPVFIPEGEIPPPNGDPLNDAIGNFVFRFGVQFEGDPNPFSDDVRWASGAAIYNAYHEIPAFGIQAPEDGQIVVYIQAESKYPFQTSDAYFDNARLVKVTDPIGDDDEPSPTPTPPADYDYPVITHGSKIGVHAITSNNVIPFCRQLKDDGARFPVVKAVDGLGLLSDVKALDPEIITIGRFTSRWEGCGELDDPGADLDAMATELLNVIVRKASADAIEATDYWEIVNEPDPPGADGYTRLAQLMIVCMEKAENMGLRLALFGLNAGTPEWDEMEAMVETGVFDRARQGGHILTLHEGTFDTHDPEKYWPDTIPGSPYVDGAGPLHFRYRFLYHLLEQRDEVIPLVVSEWYLGDEQSADADVIAGEMRWYDAQMGMDYYAWAFCPFTLGPTSAWTHTDYERVYEADVMHWMTWMKDQENALPGGDQPAPPPTPTPPEEPTEWVINDAFDYQASILLPQSVNDEDRAIIGAAASALKRDVTQSADRAYYGPPHRTVYAINPQAWGEDPTLEEWAAEAYPGAVTVPIVTESMYEAAVKIVGDLMDGDIAAAQTDMRWAAREFGEGEGSTIRRYGCFLTGLCIILRKIYGKALTPDLLDTLLRIARVAYFGDNLLHWRNAVGLFPAFDATIHENARFTAAALGELLDDGWEVILRQLDPQHFVYLEAVEGETLKIIDTFDGQRAERRPGEFQGVRAAHVRGSGSGATPPAPNPTPNPTPQPNRELLVGLHDEAGGQWMKDNGMAGCCLCHYTVQRQPVDVDLRHLQDAGITTIARLNWGYADGTGTLPPPADRDLFTSAVVSTMLSSRGVDYFHVGNEPNNKGEWPRGFELTPEYVVDIYNAIWQEVSGSAKLGPPPLDPYYGPGSNNRDWWRYILANMDGADVICLHAKTQTNDPDEVWSAEKFSDWPLKWQYLHLRTVETYLGFVAPYVWAGLPVFVTELNPQHLEVSGGDLGWRRGNATWVHEACEYLLTQRVTGACFYRYELAGDQAPFGLADKPQVLDAIKANA